MDRVKTAEDCVGVISRRDEHLERAINRIINRMPDASWEDVRAAIEDYLGRPL